MDGWFCTFSPLRFGIKTFQSPNYRCDLCSRFWSHIYFLSGNRLKIATTPEIYQKQKMERWAGRTVSFVYLTPLSPPPLSPGFCCFPLNSWFAFLDLRPENLEDPVRWREREKEKWTGNFMSITLTRTKLFWIGFVLSIFPSSFQCQRPWKPSRLRCHGRGLYWGKERWKAEEEKVL